MSDAEPPRSHSLVHGEVAPRFAKVREAFATNFEIEDEVGASLCVRVGGEVVVDLWGGHQDEARTRSWQRDTLVNVYSVGKGVLAGLLMCAVEDGKLGYDDPVVRHWPEFGSEGKASVTVRQLASHQAGLPALREVHPTEVVLDWDRMCALLALERPFWPPGTRHGYHVNTFGFLVGGVIERATGLRIPDALHHYMTGPSGADFFYGVPASSQSRCADVVAPNFVLDTEEKWAMAFEPTGDADYDRMRWHTYFNPIGASGMGMLHTEKWRSSVIPSTSGHGNGRAVADLYAGMIGSGVRFAVTPGPDVLREATRGEVDGDDVILQRPSRFGIGFQLPLPTRPLGPSPAAFGHYGYGGALGFADPANELAFGYVMNRPGDRWQTPRANRLIDAVYDCLG